MTIFNMVLSVLAALVIGVIATVATLWHLGALNGAFASSNTTGITGTGTVTTAQPAVVSVPDTGTQLEVKALQEEVEKLKAAQQPAASDLQPHAEATTTTTAQTQEMTTSSPGAIAATQDDQSSDGSIAAMPDPNQKAQYFSSSVRTGPQGEINPGMWLCGNGYRIPSAAHIIQRKMNADNTIHWLYAGFWDVNNKFHAFPKDKLVDIGTPPEGYLLNEGQSGAKFKWCQGRLVTIQDGN